MSINKMQAGTLGGRVSSYRLAPTQNQKNNQSHNNRSDILRRFQETENDDIFGNVEESDFNDIENNFQTLKTASEEIETLRPSNKYLHNLGHQFTPHTQLHPNHLADSNDLEDFELRLKLSPGETISSSSPTTPFRRKLDQKSLDKYSEDDTDVTSQFDDEDFEGIDDIFGNQEDISYAKINTQLINKRKQLEHDAEMEEKELGMRFPAHHSSLNQQYESMTTLKLKDFNHYNPTKKLGEMWFEDDVTINYDYNKDDFETFEEGFEDIHGISKLKPSRKIYPSTLNSKISMPNLNHGSGNFNPENNIGTIRHFRSTMDIAPKNDNFAIHPKFNNENKIIKKLDRIPSFYKSGNSSQKQALLDKYRENVKRNNQKKNSILQESPARHKKVSLVRCLNSLPIYDIHSKMKYNSHSKIWEGNEIDLARFDNVNKITVNDIKGLKQNLGKNSNMRYDENNLKWISTDDNEENEGVFKNIPDLVDSPKPIRGISAFTQRTSSTASTSTSTNESGDENIFTIPAKLVEKFYKEEMKIRKKTENWFGVNQNYSMDCKSKFNRDYFWEIRKMVMDTRD